jgi:hypothetical protein
MRKVIIFFSSSNIIITVTTCDRMGWVGHIECTGCTRNVHNILVVKPEGKILLGKVGIYGKLN